MRYAIVGYGRMGRELERIASARGHELVAVVDPSEVGARVAGAISSKALAHAELAFEFSAPSAAEANVVALLALELGVVCGTTGWNAESARVRRALARSRGALLVAANFSLGMSLFARLVEQAAPLFAAAGSYDPFILEAHHRFKADAPSGTARRLGALLLAADPRFGSLQEGNPRGPLGAGSVHVASLRAGHESGTHSVGFDGEHDVVTLTHRSRGRAGLALGAVLAAEWLAGKRGRHDFEEVVEALLSKGARPRGSGRRKGGKR